MVRSIVEDTAASRAATAEDHTLGDCRQPQIIVSVPSSED